MKKLALVLPVLVVIAAVVFLLVHQREKKQHINREIKAAAATHFSFDQQLELARTACDGGKVSVNGTKQILCSACPSGSDFAAPNSLPDTKGWTLDGALPGSFTAAGQDEALVHATGCEPHVKDFGGDFLLRRSAGRWSMVRYASGGTANDTCQKLTWQDGRDALVCETSSVHTGVASDAVELLLFDAGEPKPNDFASSIFFGVEDESSNCGFEASLGGKPRLMQMAKVEKVEVLPAGEDGKQDVAIDALIDRVNPPVKAGGTCVSAKPQRHHLVFNNAGDHFDAGEGYIPLHAMKRDDCCTLVITPRVVPGRY